MTANDARPKDGIENDRRDRRLVMGGVPSVTKIGRFDDGEDRLFMKTSLVRSIGHAGENNYAEEGVHSFSVQSVTVENAVNYRCQ